MASKSFLLLALAFAVVLLITSEVTAVREHASDHNSEVEDAKHGEHYKINGHSGYATTADDDEGDNNPGIQLHCRYRCCRYNLRKRCIKCCSSYAEAVVFEQTQN